MSSSFLIVDVKSVDGGGGEHIIEDNETRAMVSLCSSSSAQKKWRYEERYVGEQEHGQRHGTGENIWRSPELMESYGGQFLHDVMHGEGEYRWRRGGGGGGADATYEGRLYADRLQGYATMSFGNGAVYTGLFCNNKRFGPGAVRSPELCADVGLWLGPRLLRLAWQPPLPAVPDLAATAAAAAALAPHRTKLKSRTVRMNEDNAAVEMMRKCGATEEQIEVHWRSLCSERCTQPASAFFNRPLFDGETFGEEMKILEKTSIITEDDIEAVKGNTLHIFHCWNNSEDMIQMMQHSYKYAKSANLNVADVLNGRRQGFGPPGAHELSCRSLLLSCHLGDTLAVASLINDSKVHPDVSDCKGNSALMYASCADRHETVSFLLAAGASADRPNDAGVTPLAMCLLRYAAASRSASHQHFADLFAPHNYVPSEIDRACTEWMLACNAFSTNGLQVNKVKANSLRKLKSSSSLKINKHKNPPVVKDSTYDSEDDNVTGVELSFYNEKQNYLKAMLEFKAAQTCKLSVTNIINVEYVFQVEEIAKELYLKGMSLFEGTPAKSMTMLSKASKPADTKPKTESKKSKETLNIPMNTGDTNSISSTQLKNEKLAEIEKTLVQLVSGGASPEQARCPLPPLALAVFCGARVVAALLEHVDVDETFPQFYGYAAVDIALAGPLSDAMLETTRALLGGGADVAHTLPLPALPDDCHGAGAAGPTLLHVVLDKSVDSEAAAVLQRALLALLLGHGADAHAQFAGRSAVGCAMERDAGLLRTFGECAAVDLDAEVDAHRRSVLVNMFTWGYFAKAEQAEMLSALSGVLLLGADTLLACRSGDERYRNLFAFARDQLENATAPPPPAQKVPPNKKVAKVTAPLAEGAGAGAAAAAGDVYETALLLAAECARERHARWTRASLLAELFDVVHRFKHRPWSQIMKEHNSQKPTAMWLTAADALTTWEVLKTTDKAEFANEIVAVKVMCIIQHYQLTAFDSKNYKLSLKVIDLIEQTVKSMMKEHKMAAASSPGPALTYGVFAKQSQRLERASKYKICFECSLPLPEEPIECIYCERVYFCSEKCLDSNILSSSHPCSVLMSRPETPVSAGPAT